MALTLIATAGMLPTTTGCAALSGLAKVVSGAGWLTGVIDQAEKQSKVYLDRHPNMETEQKVASAIAKAKAAARALEASARVAKSIEEGDVARSREDAMVAFAALRSLLDELGILSATSPAGGAENSDAPKPEPFALPTDNEVEAHIGG